MLFLVIYIKVIAEYRYIGKKNSKETTALNTVAQLFVLPKGFFVETLS